jgi:hypothetical protein
MSQKAGLRSRAHSFQRMKLGASILTGGLLSVVDVAS